MRKDARQESPGNLVFMFQKVKGEVFRMKVPICPYMPVGLFWLQVCVSCKVRSLRSLRASDESCTSGVAGHFRFAAREQNALPNTEKQISNWVVGLVVQLERC